MIKTGKLESQTFKQAESARSACQPRKAMPSSYLLSTTKVCILDAGADHEQTPVEKPLDH
eukprot:1149475-Pelagomonas_calceolata.AAC.11